jgi:hypothetical protein
VTKDNSISFGLIRWVSDVKLHLDFHAATKNNIPDSLRALQSSDKSARTYPSVLCLANVLRNITRKKIENTDKHTHLTWKTLSNQRERKHGRRPVNNFTMLRSLHIVGDLQSKLWFVLPVSCDF